MRISDNQNVVVPNVVKVNSNKDVLSSNCYESIFCPLELSCLMCFQITYYHQLNYLESWILGKLQLSNWLIHLCSYLQVTEGYLMQKVKNNLVQQYNEQGI